MRQDANQSQDSNLRTQILKKETQEDEAIRVADQKRLRDCKKLRFRFTNNEKSEIVNPKSETKKSRSSVWLEHYTDNVGVSSSNLLGTTGND